VKYARLGPLIGAILVLVAVPCAATTTPTPLFNECPQVGNALGCSYLIDFGPNASIALLSDVSVKDVDSKDNILVGILNNSGTYLSLSGYTGPNSAFSSLHLTGGLWNGQSTYFEMDDPFEHDTKHVDGDDDDSGQVTPEPGSMLLLGTGLAFVGGLLRRQLRNNCQT